MLHAWRHSRTGEIRLYIRLIPSPAGPAPYEAWISPGRPRDYRGGADWVLWVRWRAAPATPEKCPLHLEVESRLRSWLLRRYRRRLFALSFDDLCEIADAERAGKGAVHAA